MLCIFIYILTNYCKQRKPFHFVLGLWKRVILKKNILEVWLGSYFFFYCYFQYSSFTILCALWYVLRQSHGRYRKKVRCHQAVEGRWLKTLVWIRSSPDRSKCHRVRRQVLPRASCIRRHISSKAFSPSLEAPERRWSHTWQGWVLALFQFSLTRYTVTKINHCIVHNEITTFYPTL